ncbi:MAG: tetratricopeptide repeat protein [Candidatus Riflebacteria bacterium]|nr:tetratricopeptide repeat protein [Candidatus Riflebacteria bacterium]
MTKRFVLFCWFFFFLFFSIPIFCKELSSELQQADEFLRIGRLNEARQIAESVYKAFPKEVESLLILGRVEIAAQNPAKAREWFRIASSVNPKHPLVKCYQKLFDQYEHRRGLLNPSLSPLPARDTHETADRFKRDWFGPNPPVAFSKVNIYIPKIASAPPEPNIITLAGVNLEIEEELDFRFQQGLDALDDGQYLQAYVLFDDLVSEYSGRKEFKLGKADAALKMGRISEARSILHDLYTSDPSNGEIKKAFQNIGLLRENSPEDSDVEMIFSPRDPVLFPKTHRGKKLDRLLKRQLR